MHNVLQRRARVLILAGVSTLACSPARVMPAGSPGGNGTGAGPVLPTVDALWLPDSGPNLSSPQADGAVAPGGACKPASCAPPGGKYCGPIGDGCGGRLNCSNDCPAGQSCGGDGTKNLCGAPPDPSCRPIPCSQAGGRLCGRVGDGCGKAQDCGACPGGETCGASIANVCGTGITVCDNLCQQQVKCPAGQETAVAGVALAPTPPRFGAADPLYNVLVYVPNRPLEPFPPGVACDLCGAPVSGAPLVSALSGPDGRFVLKNVPAGDNIPLVIQIGRWRRQVVIPKVTACSVTTLPGELTRLPRNKVEGNIPQMALATGAYDKMECLLRKVGIDDAEFTPPTGNGRVHLYKFGGFDLGTQPIPSGNTLVRTPATLARYDVVLLPCDDEEKKPAADIAKLREYSAKGGRLFLTDWADSWLRDGGEFENTATWLPEAVSLGLEFQAVADQSFPKGQAFAQWLANVGASPMPGRLAVQDPYAGYSAVSAVNLPTQRWLSTDSPERTVQHFTFNTPVGMPSDKQCGRVVFSQFHVVSNGGGLSGTFPADCLNAPMTPQEKALEFMLFDASACVQPDKDKPRVFEPPPPAPPPPPSTIE
jgi:hypothetical protein